VSQLVQTVSSTTPAKSARFSAAPYWQFAILGALGLWLYGPTLLRLVAAWRDDPNFSHGFFVPLFSAFVLWQERHRLARIAPRPSWSGVVVLAAALSLLIVGALGAELFLARTSFLFLLAGGVILFLGWSFLRAVFFPWAFLFLMIPIPVILFNQIALPLQLLASRVAAQTLPLMGVPVLRAGNIIQLPSVTLEVAQACSGIRSLMSLLTLAIIYGYLTEKRLWVRWVLALASVPIAVVANSVRIIGTGLLAQYWDAEKAEGYYHASWGLIIWILSLLLLYALRGLIRLLWRKKGSLAGTATAPSGAVSSAVACSFTPQFVLAALLLASAATYLQVHRHSEVFASRDPLQSFPMQLGAWTGTDLPIDDEVLKTLGPGDFLSRAYENGAQPHLGLFIAYFPSQRAGDTIHSPSNCLPGAGFTPVEKSRVTLNLPGHSPFPANRYVVSRGGSRQLVLYWYWAHDRGVASEYSAKYYLVADSIRMNRSDGSLVRISTLFDSSETADAAQQRVLSLAASLVLILNDYIPK
jgi:exosortase D (VPLPA-CTERM-specific)